MKLRTLDPFSQFLIPQGALLSGIDQDYVNAYLSITKVKLFLAKIRPYFGQILLTGPEPFPPRGPVNRGFTV